jgi:putative ABC transport system ATP-binding protein
MIRLEDLTVCFGELTLLDRVSMVIAPSEKIVIQGESGSGKTTLLKALVGAAAIVSGSVFFNGEPLTPDTVAGIRQSVAYIGQEPVLGADTVEDALLLPFSFKSHRGRRPADERIGDVLDAFRLGRSLLGRTCATLSGGQKQRIAIARAALLGKTVYLVDEVTSALDLTNKSAVMDHLLIPAHTVVSVSHDPDWIERCDRVVRLHAGRLLEDPGHGSS